MSDERAPDERELRDDLVGHYQAYARSRGSDPPVQALEALAVADLTLAERAESKPTAPRIAKPIEPTTSPSAAAVIAENRGYRFRKVELPAVDVARKPAPPLFEKPRALAKRMREMCATAPGSKGTSLADRNYLFPSLAKDVIQEHTDFTFRRRKYRDLDSKDRQRAFWRAIEDLADRSTGVLGPWWVK